MHVTSDGDEATIISIDSSYKVVSTILLTLDHHYHHHHRDP